MGIQLLDGDLCTKCRKWALSDSNLIGMIPKEDLYLGFEVSCRF